MKNELPDETSVSAFLDKNPTFLKSYLNNQVKTLSAKNSSISVKRDESKLGQNIIDATDKIEKRARKELRDLAQKNLSLINIAENNTEKWQRLLSFSIGLISVRTLPQFSAMLDEELPVIFKLAGARLIMPKELAFQGAEEAGFLLLSKKQIDELKGAESVYLGPPPKSGLALFSSPMASIALISLPDNLSSAISGSVLLLAGRTKDSFDADQGDTILSNLSQVVGACLEAIINQQNEI